MRADSPDRSESTNVSDGDDSDALLDALYREHAAVLWRFTLGLVHDPGRAEDIVQETLLRAWQRPTVLDQSTTSARGWLFTVARHLAVDEHRLARNQREIRTAAPPERAGPDESDRALESWLVAEALTGLSADHREVIVRAYYRGSSTHQIADELQIPEGTVKSRLHYAIRALRLVLQEMGVTDR